MFEPPPETSHVALRRRVRAIKTDYASTQERLQALADRLERVRGDRLAPLSDELEGLEAGVASLERVLEDLRRSAASARRTAVETRTRAAVERTIPAGGQVALERQLSRLRGDLQQGQAKLQATRRRLDKMPKLFYRMAEGMMYAIRSLDRPGERDDT